MHFILVALLVFMTGLSAQAYTTFVDDEAGFIAAADAACGSSNRQDESFEPSPWNLWRWDVAPFSETPLVTSQGIDWMSNVPGDPVTTTINIPHSGSFAFMSRKHGFVDLGPPVSSIFDGFRVETTGMCAMGIWLRTTTVPMDPGITLDDSVSTGVLFSDINFLWHHIGIIEPGGFWDLEVAEIEIDPFDVKHLFFDDAIIYTPEPSMGAGLMFGILAIGAGARSRRAR